MNRLLLVAFALVFLGIQVFSYMSGISKHEEQVIKIGMQTAQPASESRYFEARYNPALEMQKERNRFKAETLNFIIKILFISGATAFTFALMRAEKNNRLPPGTEKND
ncbi:MAG: hypothetical protein C4589_12385 [Peptococcaceae bacterium]|nr:MAG: hypothetical protein C4589_12385 [Peptococcaceae bacterium]